MQPPNFNQQKICERKSRKHKLMFKVIRFFLNLRTERNSDFLSIFICLCLRDRVFICFMFF